MTIQYDCVIGITVALYKNQGRNKEDSEEGGSHHGLDIMERRNSDSYVGALLISSYLQRVRLTTKSHAQERMALNGCGHIS